MLRRKGDRFLVTDQVSTLPADPGGDNLAAVRVTPSGRHVRASNRGHDSLAVLRFDPGTSALSLAGNVASPGACPRDFIIAPDGGYVIVASQDGDLVASYEFDDNTGALSLLPTAAAPTPVCLTFA